MIVRSLPESRPMARSRSPLSASVSRSIDGHFQSGLIISPQIHQDLVFDTPGGVGGKLDIFLRIKGINSLDKPDRPDGDQVFHPHSGIVKLLGNIHHQPEIVFDQKFSRLLLPVGPQITDRGRLLFLLQRRREDIRPSDIVYFPAVRKEKSTEIRHNS